MNHAEWTDAAIADLRVIKDYLTEVADGQIAQDNIEHLIEAARWLADYPFAGPSLGLHEWRKWKPRRQRYILIYQPTPNGVSIVRVHHERNDWRPAPE